VAEGYPAMAEEYLSIISEPMDFRTIEEVRLPQCEHIYEFQDDLILTFRNVRTSFLWRIIFHHFLTQFFAIVLTLQCCVFNGEHSDFYTRTM
jgi:hypothetical protein